MSGAVGDRYRAFLSYCHRDAAFARRLHRRLERYAVPRRLVGRATPRGPVPARLTPIFRDREELPAAGDLSTEVRAALAASGALIVVCSPAAAASPWVSREIETFRALHPDRPVLAVLAEGEPGEAFPAVLVTGGVEPLAADFRRGRDGTALGFLKLVSGITGVGLDELIQRDAQRRLRAVTAVTAGAVAVMLAMGALAVFAFEARAEAERRRADAEGLVDFMLSDLRGRLKGVGSLEIMGTVNARALAYYAGQDLHRLRPDQLERRARVLHAMGEDDISRRDYQRALSEFEEAGRATSALVALAPDDPERLFAQGQNDFWVGYVAYRQKEKAKASRAFGEYYAISERLAAAYPRNSKYLREAASAHGADCAMALDPPRQVDRALKACTLALHRMRQAADLPDAAPDLMKDVANREGWLADAYHAQLDRAAALTHRQTQEAILLGLLEKDPRNRALKLAWVTQQRAVANLEIETAQRPQARKRLLAARAAVDALVAFDPSNRDWLAQRELIDADLRRAGEKTP